MQQLMENVGMQNNGIPEVGIVHLSMAIFYQEGRRVL
jgi:hypothetical protein